MSIVVRFSPTNLTAENYEESIRRHQEAGIALPPDGMDSTFVGPEGNMRVSEIWDSREQLEAYGEKLMPLWVTSESSPPASQRSSRFTTSSSARPRAPTPSSRPSRRRANSRRSRRGSRARFLLAPGSGSRRRKPASQAASSWLGLLLHSAHSIGLRTCAMSSRYPKRPHRYVRRHQEYGTWEVETPPGGRSSKAKGSPRGV